MNEKIPKLLNEIRDQARFILSTTNRNQPDLRLHTGDETDLRFKR